MNYNTIVQVCAVIGAVLSHIAFKKYQERKSIKRLHDNLKASLKDIGRKLKHE